LDHFNDLSDVLCMTVLDCKLPDGMSVFILNQESISDDEARELMKDYRRITIPATAIAQSILYAINQPTEVDVNEIVVRPTASIA